jgi:HEAT repeat protein
MNESDLMRMRDAKDVDGLIKVMEGDDLDLGVIAAARLSELGEETAFEPMVDLYVKHAQEKLILGQSLVKLVFRMRRDKGVKPDPDKVAPLLTLLNNPNQYVQYGVKNIFRELGDPRYAEACGFVTDEKVINAIITDTRDLDSKKCHSAAMKLIEIGPLVADPNLRISIVDRLLEILRMPVSEEFGPARYVAAQGLGLMGDKRAVDDLILALQDPGWMIREEAAISLSELKDPKAIPALKAAASYPDDITPKAANRALQIFRQMGMS